MRKLRVKMNYANVMATIAVFLALGGGAFAAVKLGKGAVKSKNIAAGAVKTKKIANGAVTQPKIAKIKFQNQTTFGNGWAAATGLPPPQFGKDALGFVHLQGLIANGTDNAVAFTLPSGFRPT